MLARTFPWAATTFALSVIVGCSGAPLQLVPRTGIAPAQVHGASGYRVLHSFGGGADGSFPQGSLIYANGLLYGVTGRGGGVYCGRASNWCGTVFTLTTNGRERVLHRFGQGSDGWNPQGALIRVNGKFYGTTASSNAYCGTTQNGYYPAYCIGTLFSITEGGVEKVLHNFGRRPGYAASPSGPLIYVAGLLYGTTLTGGAAGRGNGTVFSGTTSGKVKVLHVFCTPSTDGCGPAGGLLDVGGMLYGTTYGGGAYRDHGTLYRMTITDRVKTLHSFGKGYDGFSPNGSLINVNGTLYGTTTYGGVNGYGTVFSMTTGGKYRVLYSFGKSGSQCCDGQNPSGGLINVEGTLYGTTFAGGALRVGTVFSLTTSGEETVLHSFGYTGDGFGPINELIDLNGTLYGTTQCGGTYGSYNCVIGGTAFALRP